jgi:hypothetical protein
MTAAMFVPAVVCIVVCAAGLLPRTTMLSWYHLLMWVAMLGVMLYRWNDYAGGNAPMFNKALPALAVMLCVGLLSAFTGTLPPMLAGHAHPFATTVKTTDGKFIVKLSITPNQSGTSVFAVTALDPNTGQAVADVGVSLSMTMPTMDMGTDTITLHPDGNGHFSANGNFSMEGKWQIRIQLQTPNGSLSEATVMLVTS